MALDDAAEAAIKKQLAEAEAEAEKWKGLSRKHEDRSKENESASDELKKLKESSLSDQQRRDAADKAAQDKLDDLERRANEADARALRAEVAAEKKLTAAQARRLAGTTREELEADADDLLETFKPAESGDEGGGGSSGRPSGGRPIPNLTGGGKPTEEGPVEMNPAKLAESVPRL